MEDNVVNISDRGKNMGRVVEENAVQLIEMGSSGKNFCLTVSKSALIAIRSGKSFPLEGLFGETKIKINVMRDTEYKKKMLAFKKLDEQAKDSVSIAKDKTDDADFGKSLGENLDQD